MKSIENPYKKNYSIKPKTYKKNYSIKPNTYKNIEINKKDIIKLNKELLDSVKNQEIKINTKKNKNNNKIIYKCDKCNISYYNIVSLEKHKPIHLNPVYCPFKDCNKMFSPKHPYQYKQHIDGHNGGLDIKCKFCKHTSKTLTLNTVHMKKEHLQQYNYYMKEIKEANKDIQPLNSKNIINLTTKYINKHIMGDLNDDSNTDNNTDNNTNTNNWYSYQYEDDDEEEDDYYYEDKEDEEDEELINIELNKYNFYYYENNLDFLSTIAILDAYKKI